MTNQEYFNESVEHFKGIVDIRNEKMMELDKVFVNKGAKTEEDVMQILKEGKLNDDELDSYYSISQLQGDVNTMSRKIYDFIYFNRIVGNELNMDALQEITGFLNFIKEYEPYKTIFILTPEKKTKEANLEEYEKNKESFKKTLGNKNIMDFINESRN